MKMRRSILSVPGHIEKMHIKAAQSEADAIMLDLEDSVPLGSKAEARRQVIQSLLNVDWQDKTISIRINGLDSSLAYRDLLEIVENAGQMLDTVVVPKVDNPGDIHFVDRMLNGMERAVDLTRTIGIEASIETAKGLAAVQSIARSSPRIESLVFGIADYSASVGARLVSLSGHGENEEAIYPGHRWHFALSRVVMTAKANGLSAIDAPYGNFKDAQGLERSTVMVCALGCDGKWAIHPGQIEIINQVFTPTQAEIERALTILKAASHAQSQGRGAVAVEGRMVDQATVRLARQLFDQAVYLGLVDGA